MIENQDLSQVKKMAEDILQNDIIERHSLYQLQCFVLAKEHTAQGKLHQCLREIKNRKQSIDAIELEILEQKDKIELIDLDILELNEQALEGIKQKRKEIQIRRLNRQRQSIESNIKDLENKYKNISEELQFFCSAFDQLNRREKLKSWDDPDVQKEYWSEKLRFETNTRLLLRQLPDIELMKTILCLHDDSPIKKNILQMLTKVNEQKSLMEQKT